MGFFKNFTGQFKANATRDVEHLRGKGALEKADFIYEKVKALFSGTWNAIIDRIVTAILFSIRGDMSKLIVLCKQAGVAPEKYYPLKLRMILKNY